MESLSDLASIHPALIKRELLKRSAKKNYVDFIKFVKPKYVFSKSGFHTALANVIDRWVKKEIRFLIIEAPPRHGKQCSDSTDILTTAGWKKHGDLNVGDYVFNPSGKAIRVNWVSEKTKSNQRVYLSNGEVVSCHENHEWNVYDRNNCAWKTMETKAIKARISGGRCNFQLPNVAPIFYAHKELAFSPYSLGAWLGDGTQSKPCITHDKKDQEVINRIVADGYAISTVCTHRTTGVLTTYFSGKMWVDIKKLNLNIQKHIPNVYKVSSIEQRLDLLAGIIDTDGSVDSKGRVRISGCNKQLIDDIVEVVESLGMRPYVMEYGPVTSSSGIVGKQRVYQVGFQPTMIIPTVIKRKKISRLVTQRRIGIVKIENNESIEYGHCIEVDSPDGLYLITKKLIPTHNSEQCSRLLPPYIFARDPNAEIIACSYSASLAEAMNSDVQNIMDSEAYVELAGKLLPDKNVRTLSGRKKRNSSLFEIIGSEKGKYVCAGVGGSITGKGGQFLIIDDYCKSGAEADSETWQENIWRWYTSTFLNRGETNLETSERASILILATRWHMKDLIGRIVEHQKKDDKSFQFVVVTFRAIKEFGDNSAIDERKDGEALFPEKYPLDELDAIKSASGSRSWGALYQQRPSNAEGALISREWIQRYSVSQTPKRFDRIIQSWDMTFKEKKDSDFVAGYVVGQLGPNFYVLERVHARMGFVKTLHEFERQCERYPKANVRLIEDKANGSAIIDVVKSKIGRVVEYQVSDSKIARLNAVSPVFEAKNFFFPDEPQYDDDIDELVSFPTGEKDDRVDALTMLLNWARENSTTSYSTFHVKR